MDTVLEKLCDEKAWEEFYENRIELGHFSEEEAAGLRRYIDEKAYLDIARALLSGTYEFGIPDITYISKSGTKKKRVVYRFPENEVWILKHIAFLLHGYDHFFSGACFSFRSGRNAKTALKEVLSIKDLDKKYCLKSDIHDYFNSIPGERLAARVASFIDDEMLQRMLINLLSTDAARDPDSGEIIHGNRGAMAGTPISPFLANLYLTDMDRHFTEEGVIYFRYADDILIFADDMERIKELKEELREYVRSEGLGINEDKSALFGPGEAWEFLGFKYEKGIIDLSENTKRKIKDKIRRKAHALMRWRAKKGTTFEQTAFVMIRVFNSKFYDVREKGDFSWSRWFFPVITTSDGLKEIDRYLIKYIRYLYKGRHYNGNYRVKYDTIRSLGYRPLVNEYYAGKQRDADDRLT